MKTSHVHRRELAVQAERHVLDIPNIAAEPEQKHLFARALACRREHDTGKLGPVRGGRCGAAALLSEFSLRK
jgi:hypothetical protein